MCACIEIMNSTRGGIEGKIGERGVWGVNSSPVCSLIHQSYNTKVDDFDIAQIGYCLVRVVRDAGTRKGPGRQNLLKDTDKILIMLKSIPWNLEGQLHSSCAKFLPIIFLA